jgi:hypothetical protein
MKGEYVVRAGVGTPNGLIDANAEILVCATGDLENITVQLVQVTDAGTVVLVTEKSLDGVVWETVDASTAETDFAAGANVAVSFTLSDANGMSQRVMAVRARASALAGGGTYRIQVSGRKAF